MQVGLATAKNLLSKLLSARVDNIPSIETVSVQLQHDDRALTLKFIENYGSRYFKQSNTAGLAPDVLDADISDKDRYFLHRLELLVESQYQNTLLNSKVACIQLALSERQFHRKVKLISGQTFTDYLRSFRLNKGAEKLEKGFSVTQVALDCGFSSQSYFSQCFKAYFSISPSQHQQR